MTPEERAQEVMRREGPRIMALVQAASQLPAARMPAARKHQRILDIAERLSRTITPHTACARGCSECCHMATNLSAYEAKLIGRFVGREPRRLRREGKVVPALGEELRARYTGAPCPFLKAGRCSVYPVRPLACRVHHTMRDDETECRLELDEAGRVINRTPALNLSPVGMASAAIFAGGDFGDIREFFPPGD
jgi:uncharacterized protein